MFTHYLKVTLRSFQKNKSAFLINVIGLSAGLICSLVILLWVQDELRFDKFHNDNARIFRAMEHQYYANGDVMTTWSTPGILAEELKKEIPEIEFASTSSWEVQHMIKYGESNQRYEGLYVDNDFLSIFSFPLLEGNPNQLIVDKRSIVITKELASSLFGEKSAIGKTVIVDNNQSFKITGVVENPPANSSIQFDYLLNAEKWRSENQWLREWGSNGPRTLVKLVENADYNYVNTKIENFIKDRSEGSVVQLFLYPFADIYLYGSFDNAIQSGGRIEYVRLFSLIAIFVLIVACINFMNLSTAKSSRRAKEVGIRKALGAYRNSLIKQYLFESFFLTFLAICVSITIIPLILPFFNDVTGKQLTFDFNLTVIISLFSIWTLTGFIAGSYPALYLSHFSPVKVLKNEIRTSWGELWARRGLVIFQFSISIFLIVSVAVVYSQIQFAMNKNLGYNRDNLIYFWLEGKLASGDQSVFINEIEKLPGVLGTSLAGHSFTGRNSNLSGISWPGKLEDEVVLFEFFRGNENLIPNMGIEISEGRNFSKDFSTDDSLAVIFNEAAIQLMRLEDPIGKTVQAFEKDRKIIGVVKDFHFESFHEKVGPAIFILSNELWVAQVRLSSDKIKQSLEQIETLHSQFNPNFVFDYTFQDESYARMYESEQRVATISKYFAVFAILISCLGLFGLASFTAERRLKEIGIRKVLGASISSLMILLSKEFTKLVLIAILISLPIAWWVAKNWLGDFAYQIELKYIYFIGAGLAALLIALITVSSQAYGAATINPVETLKDE